MPLIHGLAVKLPAKQAKALARDRHVVGLTLNTRVHSTGSTPARSPPSYPKTITRRQAVAARHHRQGRRRRRHRHRHRRRRARLQGRRRQLAHRRQRRHRRRPPRRRATASATARTSRASSPATRFNRAAGDPFYGKYVGIAPDANLIAIKASDDAGNSTVLDVINGIQFVVDHKAEFNIRVLNLSLSTDTPQSYKTDPLDAAVEYAWQKGIVVVAAAGNRGTAADAVQYAPANDPFVISVGGADENGNYGKGERADWSSTGRTQDGFAKPDVMAPGAHIVSVLAPSSAFLTLCPNCAIGGAYFKAGGTSMAAPVVAGAAALLLQARPTLTPDQVKALLMGTDKPINGQARRRRDRRRARAVHARPTRSPRSTAACSRTS